MTAIIITLSAVMVYTSNNGSSQTNNTPIVIKNNDDTKNDDNITVYGKFIKVWCTVYNPTKNQCDATPNVTYDSTEIDTKRASGYRYIGVSHDLKEMGFEMRSLVMVVGIDDYYDGVWEVRDLMNKKWKRKIDFLQSKGHRLPTEKSCIIVKIEKPIIPDSLMIKEDK